MRKQDQKGDKEWNEINDDKGKLKQVGAIIEIFHAFPRSYSMLDGVKKELLSVTSTLVRCWSRLDQKSYLNWQGIM